MDQAPGSGGDYGVLPPLLLLRLHTSARANAFLLFDHDLRHGAWQLLGDPGLWTWDGGYPVPPDVQEPGWEYAFLSWLGDRFASRRANGADALDEKGMASRARFLQSWRIWSAQLPEDLGELAHWMRFFYLHETISPAGSILDQEALGREAEGDLLGLGRLLQDPEASSPWAKSLFAFFFSFPNPYCRGEDAQTLYVPTSLRVCDREEYVERDPPEGFGDQGRERDIRLRLTRNLVRVLEAFRYWKNETSEGVAALW